MTNLVEDKLLVWEFKQGSADALQRIYQKYVAHLVTVAATLLNDVGRAEDIVHDFFVSFGQSADKVTIMGSLKAYLTACVVNRVRDDRRRRKREAAALNDSEPARNAPDAPEFLAVRNEEHQRITIALGKLPYEQREVVVLHLQGGLMFRQIGRLQSVSANTAWSRYRYALKKLREHLNGEAIQ